MWGKINIRSKIFVDGANPEETQEAKKLLGFVDGQTTNPTLVSKNPEVKERIEKGRKFGKEEIYHFYKEIVEKISQTTQGPISIEAYADKETRAEEMAKEARRLSRWVNNSYIKLPIIKEGLRAAEMLVKEGIRINMTLCFSQEQAAAVYSATKGAKHSVFISPFVGRLDDREENGMDLVKNIIRMYQDGDNHVLPLTASVRSLDHLLQAIKLGSPLITAPFKIIKEWADKDFILPDENFNYQPELKPIGYQEISLNKHWQDYDISHDLTDIGVEKFSQDWRNLIQLR